MPTTYINPRMAFGCVPLPWLVCKMSHIDSDAKLLYGYLIDKCAGRNTFEVSVELAELDLGMTAEQVKGAFKLLCAAKMIDARWDGAGEGLALVDLPAIEVEEWAVEVVE